MIKKFNKIGSAIKSGTKMVGHVLASGARRTWSRFKRLPAVIPNDKVINFVLKQWINNSQQVEGMPLEKIFRRGGPCDIKVLKTCIGSMKARRDKTALSSHDNFNTFNDSDLKSEIEALRATCDSVYMSLNTNNRQTILQKLEDLKNGFHVLKEDRWDIPGSGAEVTNPYSENVDGIIQFINRTIQR